MYLGEEFLGAQVKVVRQDSVVGAFSIATFSVGEILA